MSDARRARSELRKELEAFLAVDQETVEKADPLIRAVVETLRDRSSIIVRSAERPLTDMEIGDLGDTAKPRWVWVDGFNRLPPGSVWDLNDENLELWRRNGAPQQVWIRWDLLSPGQRRIAASAATFLVALFHGSGRTGRPRGSRLQPAEAQVVEDLGERLWSISWSDGVRAMVDAGAWRAPAAAPRSPRERRALQARWRRLLARAAEIQSRPIGTTNPE